MDKCSVKLKSERGLPVTVWKTLIKYHLIWVVRLFGYKMWKLQKLGPVYLQPGKINSPQN